MSRHKDDDLAYGEYHGQGAENEGDRGFVGDVFRRIRGKPPQNEPSSTTSFQQSQNPQGQQQSSGSQNTSSAGGMSFVFDKLHQAVHQVGSEIKNRLNVDGDTHSHTHGSGQCTDGSHDHHKDNRYYSFAPQRSGNDIKWYVDACGYMWAVSVALEQARESIWIMDWWLSPELYLRRPPAKFEQYRVDRMLKAAAERGVKVNVIVYKEVTQALTRKLLNPVLPDYLHSLLPHQTDSATRFLARLGLDVTFAALEEVEKTDPLIAAPISVSSSHTKHALEDLHPNIGVFRHPDHLPDAQTLQSSFVSQFQSQTLSAASLVKMPVDTLKTLYGSNEGTVLYWGHHEKLCLIDGHIAFMGGLDLCYGRWDTNQHAISDVHPSDINDIVFPGQDYNNARIMDFQDVVHWQNNKLDRTQSSRMGWSDVSLCLSGPSVWDLKNHFVQRWNFIYDEKYQVRKDNRYSRLALDGQSAHPVGPSGGFGGQGQYFAPPSQGYGSQRGEGQEENSRGGDDQAGERGFFGGSGQGGFRPDQLYNRLQEGREKLETKLGVPHSHSRPTSPGSSGNVGNIQTTGGAECQLTRSCAKWSHGVSVEHSIANAYIDVIRESQHFVYIENQFFITATGPQQKPVKNMIGAAIVERIVRAGRNNERYMMIIMIPAIPAFAGDLRSDDALSTRAIMEFQYNSINRGNGYSIYELIAKEGVDPLQYIRFYNLRNYDRINVSKAMQQAEQQSGVKYEEARKQYDAQYGGGYANAPPSGAQQGYQQPVASSEGTYGPGGVPGQGGPNPGGYGDRPQYSGNDPYQRYQEGAQQVGSLQGLGTGRWDSVSECYMLGGEDIRNVPWENGNMEEIDAFVSEELYIHSKLLLSAFRTAGFLYLTNHPIPKPTLSRIFAHSQSFFARPNSQKEQLAWYSPEANRGYTAPGREKVTQLTDSDAVAALRDQNPDLKESMEIGKEGEEGMPNMWPDSFDEEGQEFRTEMQTFFLECAKLHAQVMRAIAVGMGLEESFFDGYTDRNDNTLRLLHYPGVKKSVFRENVGQVRAGEHSDYGSITLLFQDQRGGLQVLSPQGTFVDATPIPDTIVVNAGDLLARWSNDDIKSTNHRVVEPPLLPGQEEAEEYPPRYSIAYFCNPNFDKTIDAIPGTYGEGVEKKYDAINSGDYLVQRLAATY